MRSLSKIIIHCSDTYPEMDIGVNDIREWHRSRGFSDVGYHYVIRRDGTVETGRSVGRAGAHVQGHNVDSIGICVVGGKAHGEKPVSNFTHPQLHSLAILVMDLLREHGDIEVTGHCEFDAMKTCPNFDVKEWWKII